MPNHIYGLIQDDELDKDYFKLKQIADKVSQKNKFMVMNKYVVKEPKEIKIITQSTPKFDVKKASDKLMQDLNIMFHPEDISSEDPNE
mmetsp:Transcript_32990/g.29246  ORF Transcript_32990/g.29246 Transcript_32990/m.29246 type:complete len:88 (+) Transcript_32990:595-858(+)